MFVGHYGPAFALKGEDNKIPLWQMFVAVQFVDFLWAGLTLAGVEKFEVVPGITATNPLDLIYYPFSHSLMATLGWAALCGVWMMRMYGASRKMAVLIGLAVVSHWFTDLLVHIPDLPLYGDYHKLGFGIWNFPLAAFVLEIGLVIGGILWWKHRVADGRMKPMLILAGVLTVFHLTAFFGMEPPGKTEVAVMSLGLFSGLAFLAYWLVDRPKKPQGL